MASTLCKDAPSEEGSSAELDEAGWVEIAGKRYLTQVGLAQQLKISRRTVARWDVLRIGPPKIKIGRSLILYDPEKLLNWLAEHEEQPLRRLPRTHRRAVQ